LLPEKGL